MTEYRPGDVVVRHEGCLYAGNKAVILKYLGDVAGYSVYNCNEGGVQTWHHDYFYLMNEKKKMDSVEAFNIMHDMSGIEVGDYVAVVRRWERGEYGFDCGSIAVKVGPRYEVAGIDSCDGYKFFKLKANSSYELYAAPFFAVKLLEKAFKPVEVKLNDEYTAVVHKDKVVVGCQEFSHQAIIKLINAVHEVSRSC